MYTLFNDFFFHFQMLHKTPVPFLPEMDDSSVLLLFLVQCWYMDKIQRVKYDCLSSFLILASFTLSFVYLLKITNKIHNNDVRLCAPYFNLDTNNQTTDTIKHRQVTERRWIVRVTFTYIHTCLHWKSTCSSPHWSTDHSGLFPSFPSVKLCSDLKRFDPFEFVLFRFVAISSPSFPFPLPLFLSFPLSYWQRYQQMSLPHVRTGWHNI